VLRVISERMRKAVRPNDTVGRYGGEEFLVVLPGCQHETLLRVAERLRETVASEPVEFEGTDIPVTISIGATMAVEGAFSEHMLMKAADLGLYRAKQGGRNRVETRWVTPSLANIKSVKPVNGER
jgi:two-component system cell cycle response regulator